MPSLVEIGYIEEEDKKSSQTTDDRPCCQLSCQLNWHRGTGASITQLTAVYGVLLVFSSPEPKAEAEASLLLGNILRWAMWHMGLLYSPSHSFFLQERVGCVYPPPPFHHAIFFSLELSDFLLSSVNFSHFLSFSSGDFNQTRHKAPLSNGGSCLFK